MLDYIRRRIAASIEYRIDAALARRQLVRASDVTRISMTREGDPFVRHTQCAIAAMSDAVAAIYGYDVEGDVAEFGTMSGQTAVGLATAIANCDRAMAHAVQAYGQKPRRLFLFDSFVGLPQSPPDSIDGRSPHVQDGVWSAGSCHGVSLDQLAAMVGAHLAPDRIEIVPGWFSNTVPALDGQLRFALLHIDSDLYSSAMDVLDTLLTRGMVARGAYLFFDDWNCNRADPTLGERRAWDECVAKHQIAFSDGGNYGIFAKCLIVHDYAGSPGSDLRAGPANTTVAEPAGIAPATPTVETDADEPTSTDVYDHQEASRGYHAQIGIGDMDPPFAPIYERCRAFSMTSADRLYAVYKAVEYLQSARIEGDIVECGVWRGGSMMVAAESLRLFDGPRRRLHLFDTYEGLPEPKKEDVDVWGHAAQEWWQQKRKSEFGSDWARSHIDEVKANLAQTGFPADDIVLVKGMVEQTLPAHAPDKIALLRLDTDWYASTKHELEHLFPRLARNGVLIIDDYGHFKGAKQAVDEYLAAHKVPLMLVRLDYTGRLAIKTHG